MIVQAQSLRRRRGSLIYLTCSCVFVAICFFHSISKHAQNSGTNQPGESISGASSYPWQMIGYDEYGCGCPRYGPPIIESAQQSICSDWSTSRGMGQRVVSYTLYGDMRKKRVYQHYYSAIEDRLKDVQKYYKGECSLSFS